MKTLKKSDFEPSAKKDANEGVNFILNLMKKYPNLLSQLEQLHDESEDGVINPEKLRQLFREVETATPLLESINEITRELRGNMTRFFEKEDVSTYKKLIKEMKECIAKAAPIDISSLADALRLYSEKAGLSLKYHNIDHCQRQIVIEPGNELADFYEFQGDRYAVVLSEPNEINIFTLNTYGKDKGEGNLYFPVNNLHIADQRLEKTLSFLPDAERFCSYEIFKIIRQKVGNRKAKSHYFQELLTLDDVRKDLFQTFIKIKGIPVNMRDEIRMAFDQAVKDICNIRI